VHIFDPVVPGDRLVNAVGSPGKRAGENQDQSAVLLEGDEALDLICLVGDVELVWDRGPNLDTLPNLVMSLGMCQRTYKKA